MLDVGIEHPNLFRSFGIFGIVLVILVLLFLIYLLLGWCHRHHWLGPILEKIRLILKKKLKYQSEIRYLMQSNLKITHNSVFFLVLTGGFTTAT